MQNNLEHFIENIKSLPTLSPVSAKLIEISSDDKCGMRELSQVISSDQALSTKVIRLANFAFLNTKKHDGEISTVDRALALLGIDMVRSIALTVSIIDIFDNDLKGRFNLEEFWRHSISCAIASELFAKHFSYPHPDEAFFAGLLHDLGKFILFNYQPAKYNRLITKVHTTGSRLLEKEEIHLGMGHTQAAKILMEQWNFPNALIVPAWLHHQPFTNPETDPLKNLPFIVKCANSLCHIQKFGDSGNYAGDMNVDELQTATGVTSFEKLKALSSQLLDRFEDVSNLFDWKNSTSELYLSSIRRSNEEFADIHIRFMQTNRKYKLHQELTNMFDKLQETLERPISTKKSMEIALELLAQTTNSKHLLSFLFNWQKKTIEVWIKPSVKHSIEWLYLPIHDSVNTEKKYKSSEMVTIIKDSIKNLEDETSLVTSIINTLKSDGLTILPLQANGTTFGHIMTESGSTDWTEEEYTELITQHAKCTSRITGQTLLVKTMDQQAEDIARVSRNAEEHKKMLYHAERLASVGRVAAGAAHEINNPLATISIKSQIMQEKILQKQLDSETNFNGLNLIIEQSARIAKITNDLMGFASPPEPQTLPSEVTSIIKRTLSLMEEQTKLSNVKVVTEFEQNVLIVDADPKQLEQVFLNLIVNANHAMKDDGGTLTIRARIRGENQQITIEFIDTGIGIEPENLSKIFDPFYTLKKIGDGTGLGLSICNSIIEGHKGKITVTSKQGNGSTFMINLPLSKESLIEDITIKPDTNTQVISTEPVDRPASVLIIDDNEGLRSTLVETLTDHGYEIDTAVDGNDGVIKIVEKNYNVVVLDLLIPKRKGLEVLNIIKTLDSKLPVIIISGVAHRAEFNSAKESGAFACMRKPFGLTDFLSMVKEAADYANKN